MRKYRLVKYFLKAFLVGSIILITGLQQNSNAQIIRKSLIEFYSSDSLLISADHYFSSRENPYIILFHREGSSRGEFEAIAERFVKMRFNCLAVDMRNGDNFGFVNNKTAARAKEMNIDTDAKAELDVLAAIDYISQISQQSVVLLGSSYSASLCLKIATENDSVRAIMTFSPGEFFRPQLTLNEIFQLLDQPVYIACNTAEYPFLLEAVEGIDSENLTLVKPPENAENRGVGLLSDNNPVSDIYWLSVLIFIKSLQN
ncbi:MAG: hypothetical protein ACP5E3_01565 [Bacteroidales bacterium]